MERGTSRTTSQKHGREGRRRLEELDRSLWSTDTGVSGPTGISGPDNQASARPPDYLSVKSQTSLEGGPEMDRSLRPDQSLRTKTEVSGVLTPESPA